MELTEFLEEQFREILMMYGKERTELSDSDTLLIRACVLSELHMHTNENEVKLLYKSFYGAWWKNHAMPPRTKKAAASA